MVGILLVLAALAFLNAADEHATAKAAEFWGNRIAARELAIVHESKPVPQPVQRFGYQFGVHGE